MSVVLCGVGALRLLLQLLLQPVRLVERARQQPCPGVGRLLLAARIPLSPQSITAAVFTFVVGSASGILSLSERIRPKPRRAGHAAKPHLALLNIL